MPVLRLLCAAALLLLGCLSVLAGPAHTAPPQRLGDHIVDQANVLGATGRASVGASVDQLFNEHGVRMWVVFVDDFGGRDRSSWAEESARLNGFNDRDVLFAVAVKDRDYVLSTPQLPGLTASELTKIEGHAEAALRASNWAGAATGVANDLGSGMSSSAINWTALAVGGGAIAAGGAGVTLYLRRRKSLRDKADSATARTIDPSDTTALRRLPVEALDKRSHEVLIEMDNAVRTSAGELALAESEFGSAAVAPFAAALNEARAALAHAFVIRQQLDDAIPETAEQQRELLVTLISECGKADHTLDAQVAEFDSMRDLLINAAARLDTLTQKTVALRVRTPETGAVLAGLAAKFAPAALAPVSRNVTMATERIVFAEENIGAARSAIALPPGKQGAAVGAIRSAEDAVTQAKTLLDAVDGAEAAIGTAIAQLPAALADARSDIATAAGFPDDQAVTRARAAAEIALTQAEREQPANPLGAYTALVAADATLDQAIAAATERAAEAARAQQILAQTLSAAQAQTRAAADFVETRRGAIGAAARTQLAEAQRNLHQADSATDITQAIQFAHTATLLAQQALRSAQDDVSQWERSQPSDSGLGTAAGAVLGGILIDSVLRGGFSSGSRGGRFGGESDGFNPGSFGGAGSSRRIGGSRF